MSLLEMNGISKAFNGVQVLKGVRLKVERGRSMPCLGKTGRGSRP
jgi:ribose transport system ATP-binding protein